MSGVLDVLLHGEPVGTLTHIDGDRTIFSFEDAYVADDGRRECPGRC